MATPAMSKQAELCLDAALPIDTSSEPIMFQSCTLARQGTHINTSGIRGTRQHDDQRVREGPYRCSGVISMIPTADELEYWLARIQGTAKDGSNDYVPAETVPEFQCMQDLVTKVATYAGCKVSRATFSAQAGGPLSLSVEVEAETETIAAAGGFPSLTYKSDQPYVMSDMAVTLEGTGSRFVSSFELTIDNHLDTERFGNSTTRSELPEMDRTVSLSFEVPYSTDEADLYEIAVGGAQALIVFTNAGDSADALTFTCANYKVPPVGPGIQVPSEIGLSLAGQVFRTAAANDLVIRHVLA